MPQQREVFLLLLDLVCLIITNTASRKTNTKEIIGAAGVRNILEIMRGAGHGIPSVCIGGINAANLQRIVFQCGSSEVGLHGVAVVSAIMAAPDPQRAARSLLNLVKNPPVFQDDTFKGRTDDCDERYIIAQAPSIIQRTHETTPLSHNLTNIVRL
jgi:thiamine-phosphate diphosphorylase/hydroxyethylthiazole kinase